MTLPKNPDYWAEIDYLDQTRGVNPAGIKAPPKQYDCLGNQQWITHLPKAFSTTALVFVKQHAQPAISYLEVYATAIERATHNLHPDTITSWAKRLAEHTLHDDAVIRIYRDTTPERQVKHANQN